jgi:uncharacterized membrane protein YcaP (DUF421 family)
MPTIVHAVAGYFILLMIIRVLKRRPGSQMTLFEFVIVFLMGGIIILSTVGNDRSVTNCTCAVIAVALMHRSLAWAKSRSPRLGAIVDGTPLIIIRKGQWQPEIVKGMSLRREDIEAAGRAAGLTNVDDIDYAILERNGRISVIPKEKSK